MFVNVENSTAANNRRQLEHSNLLSVRLILANFESAWKLKEGEVGRGGEDKKEMGEHEKVEKEDDDGDGKEKNTPKI